MNKTRESLVESNVHPSLNLLDCAEVSPDTLKHCKQPQVYENVDIGSAHIDAVSANTYGICYTKPYERLPYLVGAIMKQPKLRQWQNRHGIV